MDKSLWIRKHIEHFIAWYLYSETVIADVLPAGVTAVQYANGIMSLIRRVYLEGMLTITLSGSWFFKSFS